MKQVYTIMLLVLLFSISAGCSKGEPVQEGKEKSFSSEKEAVEHFLDEHPGSDVESIVTTVGEKLWVTRSANHAYSIFGMKEERGNYAVVRISAQLSLHNTIGGKAEVTSPQGTDYTVSFVKKGKRDELAGAVTASYFTIFNGGAEAAVHEGHVLDTQDPHRGESAVQSSVAIQMKESAK